MRRRTIEERAADTMEGFATGLSDLLERFSQDLLFHDRFYTIWSDAERIHMTVHDKGKPIVRADWSMAEIDTALSALRREILANAHLVLHE